MCLRVGNQDGGDDDTEIYWLRPKPRSPRCSPSDSDRMNWFSKKLNSSQQKHKVTFDDTIMRLNITIIIIITKLFVSQK